MSDIKKYFTSRWGEDGRIVEADFAQLEVIVLAIASGDPVLKQDIRDGKDTHSMAASFIYGEDYDVIRKAYLAGDPEWSKKRGLAKGPNFLLTYGGGAKLMAENTGLKQEDCQRFIDKYYERYSRVKEWQDEVADKVKKTRHPSDKVTAAGVTAGEGSYIGPTGRKWVFREFDAPSYVVRRGGSPTSFSPTQMKNYPIQGTAADIVVHVLGKLFLALRKSNVYDKVKIINTVHDSIIFDVHVDALSRACDSIRRVMESTPQLVKNHFGIDFDLPLNVDVEVGPNWGEIINWEK